MGKNNQGNRNNQNKEAQKNMNNQINNAENSNTQAIVDEKLQELNESEDSFEWIPVKSLMNNSEIQRMLNSQRVHRIVEGFNPLLVNPIKVSERDGKHYVFDGAHTLAALIEMHRQRGEKDFLVLCRVFHGLKLED